MPAITESRTWDSLLTTTIANFRKTMVEQIFDVYPYLSYLDGTLGGIVRPRGAGAVKRLVQGGESIEERLMYEQNSTVDSFSDYQVIDTTPQEGMTLARYEWALYSAVVSISGKEKRANRSSAKIIDLLDQKVKQAIMSFRDRLSRNAYAASVGNGGLDIIGIGLLFDSTGTVGNVNPSTNSWWAATETAGGSFAAQGIDDMDSTFNTVTFGNDKPDAIFTTQTIFQYYKKSLVDQKRFQSDKAADAGFVNLLFNGVPIFFDRDCTSGTIYFPNSEWLSWVVDDQADFAMSPMVDRFDQDAFSQKIILQAQQTTNNRRKLAKITGITA